ncbi:MAG: Fe-S cluster assembly protein IscX [Granulosicoccaceae bacterium]
MKWIDTLDIAIELAETKTDVDPQMVRFTDLHAWVMALEDFDDEPEKSSERILEAIQLAWIDEASDD